MSGGSSMAEESKVPASVASPDAESESCREIRAGIARRVTESRRAYVRCELTFIGEQLGVMQTLLKMGKVEADYKDRYEALALEYAHLCEDLGDWLGPPRKFSKT